MGFSKQLSKILSLCAGNKYFLMKDLRIFYGRLSCHQEILMNIDWKNDIKNEIDSKY